jgi:hypothetical protein
MAGSLRHVIGAVSLLSALAGASVAGAQAGRPWVDPPADVGAAAKTPPAAPQPPSPSAASPNGASHDERKTSPAMTPRTESASTAQPSAAPEQAAAPEGQVTRKTVEEGKVRQSSKSTAAARPKSPVTRKAVASNRPKAPPSVRVREAERPTRSIRSAKVRDGINSGLEVMSLQTIEFPDGRRVEVLVRPSPRALSRLMDGPY